MHKRRHEEEHENEERWLLTYADLITLLMVFFTVMYALSQVNIGKYQQMAASLSGAFHSVRTAPIDLGQGSGGQGGDEPTMRARESRKPQPPQPAPTPPTTEVKPSAEMQKIQSEFLDLVKKAGLEGSISVSISADGQELYVRLSDSLLFDPGSATLTEAAMSLMDKIGIVIAEAGKPVRVEGHTDNIPIHNARFDSNWQLSSERASYVIKYLTEKFQIDPAKFSASGYSEYRPLAPNDTPEGRAKNRRVEFVILDQAN